ncbi:glycoside hydrolase family 32 protein [Pedobacter sp. UBA4863]|uniref:glycoside hydrolase family 32 protein n=1 Tax=Pedobacter sp. UBA4863 TaxID=1947060 RepID=UPI0025D1A3F5|nr:glycoside hydrolase family 32 protein [Pedobacter sp. UBA4863]
MIKKTVALLGFLSCGSFFVSQAQEKQDYTSKVPQYKFSNDEKKQLKELESNPLLKRFAESRKELAKDPHRPIYHFTSPESRLNDPNGLSFWNGKWHLFYQGYPPEDTRQHWGHAISDDLINWKDLPYAIYPNPERASFSGAVIIEKDRAIAMYHGTTLGNIVAVSKDPLLLNWEKLTGEAVIPLKSDKKPFPPAIFDPTIWKKGDYYYSLSAGRENMRPSNMPFATNYLFRSKDLVNWEYMHKFIEGDRFTLPGDDGACPYFLPIGDPNGNKYIMAFFSHMTGGQYFLGTYDKEKDKFYVEKHDKFNFGPVGPGGVHAPSAYPDGKGGVMIIFNMNRGKNTKGWDQIMSLPRRLILLPNNEIGVEPVNTIESLRGEKQTLSNIELPANKEIVINEVKGNAIEINLEVDVKFAQTFEMNVLRSPDKREYTKISFQKKRGYYAGRRYASIANHTTGHASAITIDNTNSSLAPDAASRPPETAQVVLDDKETVKMRIFIDKSVVEVFVNGKQCVALRAYPTLSESIGVSFKSIGNPSLIKALEAYQMNAIKY